jgi:hypothetical protein
VLTIYRWQQQKREKGKNVKESIDVFISNPNLNESTETNFFGGVIGFNSQSQRTKTTVGRAKRLV